MYSEPRHGVVLPQDCLGKVVEWLGWKDATSLRLTCYQIEQVVQAMPSSFWGSLILARRLRLRQIVIRNNMCPSVPDALWTKKNVHQFVVDPSSNSIPDAVWKGVHTIYCLGTDTLVRIGNIALEQQIQPHLCRLVMFQRTVDQRVNVDMAVIAKMKAMCELEARASSILNLSAIKVLKHLHTLNIGFTRHIRRGIDIAHISELPNVKVLMLTGSMPTNMEHLCTMTQLESLCLDCHSWDFITGLYPFLCIPADYSTRRPVLSTLTNLTSLKIWYNPYVSNLRQLLFSTRLTVLDLHDSQNLEDIAPISEMEHLSSLTLSGCGRISDFVSIGQLTKLEQLCLNSCSGLVSVSWMHGLSRLHTLQLAHCDNLVDVSGVVFLTGIVDLNIESCKAIPHLSPFTSLTQLKRLKMRSTRFPDNNCIGVFESLVYLDASDCTLDNIGSVLQGLSHLEALKLGPSSKSNRSFVDTSVLKYLPKLTALNISQMTEQIVDISGLYASTQLRVLNVSSCKELEDFGFLNNMTNMQKLNLSYCDKLNGTPFLDRMPHLLVLDLRGCPNVPCNVRVQRTSTMHDFLPSTDKEIQASLFEDW